MAARRSCSATGRQPRRPCRRCRRRARCGRPTWSTCRRGCAARSPRCSPASRWSVTWPRRSTWSRRSPQLRAVTRRRRSGGAGWVSGGSDRKPSTLEITSEIEKARDELDAAEKQASELSAALSGALTEQAARQDAAEQALAALNESDAAISAIYEQLGRLGQDARAAEEEWQRLIRQRDELETGRGQTVEELAELEQRLHNAEQAPMFDAEPVDRQRDRRGGRGRAGRRGGSAAGGAHRRGTRECRSGTGGFAAPGGRRRTRGPAAGRSGHARPASTPRPSRPRWPTSGRRWRSGSAATVGVASRTRDALAAERHQRADALAKVRERGQRTDRQDRRAHRGAAPRRGRQSPSGASHRAARTSTCSSNSAWPPPT